MNDEQEISILPAGINLSAFIIKKTKDTGISSRAGSEYRASIFTSLLFWDYSRVSNNHTLCYYLFQRKILPCAFISPVLNSTMTALCVYLFFEKKPVLCD